MSAAYATFGNVTIDDLVFPDGSTMWRTPGGNSIYSALGIAVWGERPDVVAPVGPDYPIEALQNRVDLSHCRPLERTLRNWGLYEEDGTRTFTFRSASRNWHAFSPTKSDIKGARYRYAHLAPLPWDLHIAFADHLRESGAEVISVDPDDRHLDEVPPSDLKRLLESVDLFLPSRQDAVALMPGREPADAIRALRDIAPELPVIAVKCGGDGVLLHAAASPDLVHIGTAAEAVIDTTGAGDAFSGGALVGYARTRDPVEAALRGSVSASYAVAVNGPGALVRARAEEAETRLERLRATIETTPI